MQQNKFEAQFFYSVPSVSKMKEHGPEIAFIGRSNAGKSSLINSLCHRKELARTSKNPGQTKHAVVYKLFNADKKKENQIYFVDLPGFGYAKMSKNEAKLCENLIFSYLEERSKIDLLCLLLDMRRKPDEREKAIIDIANARGINYFLILTKHDQVPLSKRKPIINSIKLLLNIPKEQITLHSIKESKSSVDLRKKIINTTINSY